MTVVPPPHGQPGTIFARPGTSRMTSMSDWVVGDTSQQSGGFRRRAGDFRRDCRDGHQPRARQSPSWGRSAPSVVSSP